MAASVLSSIIFFLLFIMPSLFVDAHMEHRKLSGTKETMTMRRNLEGSGHANSKIATPGSTSRHSGQKNIQHKPSKTRPDQLQSRISYGGTDTTKCSYYTKNIDKMIMTLIYL
ncbi:hypothetical protein F2Q69_00061268 [Brassica cretica]|uniref:Neprosin activation peptide domain-containing protein n=2 Tax=Brassica TaxID=3705 RepID=A0A8S9RD02_BRACR|nr:hypothetical protein F2Q69_00061268 [Brassica cretica]